MQYLKLPDAIEDRQDESILADTGLYGSNGALERRHLAGKYYDLRREARGGMLERDDGRGPVTERAANHEPVL